MADAIAAGGAIHAFGSGHSHMLAEELFYRAGGLVRVRPMLFEGLMLHASAPLGTALERLPGLAAALLDDHPMAAGDVLIIASNSGGNAVSTELARLARERARAHHRHHQPARMPPRPSARSIRRTAPAPDRGRRHRQRRRVRAMRRSPSRASTPRVAPTSTVTGAAIVNAVVAEVVERLVHAGHRA